ncbi:hypothetical protein [Campylobacter sp. TTU_617]|uniref:hypothetical protein n=1 Tax=Campylobacter sp. TTU_617 TaxID=2768148 RepID=UPI0019072895|nr:hypothetical protein [Campylobacter sp. TTU_617]MBK1971036.1 hypothetical protein [Campylobacter sp. TTU_617]
MLGVSKNWINNFAIFQNKQTGHGLAAELMNHQNEKIIDQITKNAKIVGGDNAKNGADRIVNGVEIQTKYYKTPQKTINSAFDNQGNGNYRYYTKDNKPMTLEVPKDQYDYAVKNMEEKIAQGKVPGISDPSEAKNIIKKGSVTYQEAKNYSKFCSKESLKFDAKNGAVVASTAFGISFVINTYVLYYQNQNIKEAIRQSAILAFKSGGQAFTVYMIATQVQRIELVNKFLQQVINFNFKGALGQRIAQGLALSSGKEAIKTTTAMQNAANNALRGQVVVAATMMAITSGIEIHQMMRGKISSMQCVKNIIVNSSSIAGGVAGAIITGAALGSVVPGVGNLVGGFVGGMIGGIGVSKITKNILDNYIEDDLTKKQRIFFNHIITLSTLFKLSNAEASEFSMIVDKMIQEDKNFFKDKLNASMILASSNKILKPIVVLIVSNRTKLPLHTFNKEIIAEVIDEEIEEMIN